MQSIIVPLHSRYSSSLNGIPYHSWSCDVILVIPSRLTSFLIIHRNSPSFNVFTHLYGIALHIIYVIRHLLSALYIIKRHLYHLLSPHAPLFARLTPRSTYLSRLSSPRSYLVLASDPPCPDNPKE